MADRYARDPDYGTPPRWGRLYDRHCPRDTDGCSRHVKMMAEMLRDPKHPIRRAMIDLGYEPDHWAQSMEYTVRGLWQTRARLWKVDPEGEQRRLDRALAKYAPSLTPASDEG